MVMVRGDSCQLCFLISSDALASRGHAYRVYGCDFRGLVVDICKLELLLGTVEFHVLRQ